MSDINPSNAGATPAFYIDASPIKWPVTVRMPADGGRFVDFVFTGHFARLSIEEVKALEDADELNALPSDATRAEKDLAIQRDNLRKIPHYLVDWEGVRQGVGANSPAVPFSQKVLFDQLSGANSRVLAVGVWRAVNEINMGVRLGNFEPLPEPGPGNGSVPAETAAP